MKPINYSEIIQRAGACVVLLSCLVKPQATPSPSPSHRAATETQSQPAEATPPSPFIASILATPPSVLAVPHCCPPLITRFETVDTFVQASVLPTPSVTEIDVEVPFVPSKVVAVPDGFPKMPTDIYRIGSLSGMPLDVAFFAFALSQNSFTQYNAARVLRANVADEAGGDV